MRLHPRLLLLDETTFVDDTGVGHTYYLAAQYTKDPSAAGARKHVVFGLGVLATGLGLIPRSSVTLLDLAYARLENSRKSDEASK